MRNGTRLWENQCSAWASLLQPLVAWFHRPDALSPTLDDALVAAERGEMSTVGRYVRERRRPQDRRVGAARLIQAAVCAHQNGVVSRLLRFYDAASDDSTSLRLAVEKNNPKAFSLLLPRSDVPLSNALLMALLHRRFSMADRLIQSAPVRGLTGTEALVRAVELGRLDAASYLLRAFERPDDASRAIGACLVAACTSDSTDPLRWVLSHATDRQVQSESSRPLYLAAAAGCTAAVALLLPRSRLNDVFFRLHAEEHVLGLNSLAPYLEEEKCRLVWKTAQDRGKQSMYRVFEARLHALKSQERLASACPAAPALPSRRRL